MKTFVLYSGYFNIVGGVLLLGYWYLYAVLLPYGELSTTLSILVVDKNWGLVNVLGMSGALLAIVGLVGLFINMEGEITPKVTWGFILALLGGILMFAALMRDTLMWPILVNHDPSLLDFAGPIYTSKTFFPFFIFSGVLYTAGYVLFGLAIADASMYPVAAGHLLAWGAVLFGLGPALGGAQVVIRTIGITALGAGMVWLGVVVSFARDVVEKVQAMA